MIKDEQNSSIDTEIDIALASYNGIHYLPTLIRSIFLQENKSWKIILRDDKSTDSTYLYIQKQLSNNENITLLDSTKNLGVIKNFETILSASKAKYIMLADQDDYWKSNKVKDCLSGIKKIEDKYGDERPILFITDLEVVDSNLKVLNPSFWDYENIDIHSSIHLERLLVRNVSPGCSMILNKALLEIVLPFPKGIMMHDWWIILVASIFGKIGLSGQASIQYRQHDSNIEGAKKHSLLKKSIQFIFKLKTIKRTTKLTQLQAQTLLHRFSGSLDDDSKEIIKAYCNVRNEKKWKHKLRCYQQGIRARGILSSIGLYLLL